MRTVLTDKKFTSENDYTQNYWIFDLFKDCKTTIRFLTCSKQLLNKCISEHGCTSKLLPQKMHFQTVVFFWQVLVSIFWLFLLLLCFVNNTLQLFLYNIFLQDFFSVNPVITLFYRLLCRINKKNLFQLIHNSNAIKSV